MAEFRTRQVELDRGVFSLYELDLAAASSSSSNSSSSTSTSNNSPLVVLHHGAGHSGATWVLLAQALELALANSPDLGCSLLAFDARGHGTTSSSPDDDLSLTTLSDDLAAIVAHALQSRQRDLFLVGHSLGGAVVVDAMARGLIKNVRGVAVLDVVEGTAVDSLVHMKSLLATRPASFPSLDAAVRWAVKSHHSGTKQIAEITIPSQLAAASDGTFTWRTDLSKSSVHWEGWFADLSKKFLEAKAGRLLVLAGTDRLDKPLTIGQMQGKFQMVIVAESGHNIQEDAPGKLATTLLDFIKRNQSIAVIKRFAIPVKDK